MQKSDRRTSRQRNVPAAVDTKRAQDTDYTSQYTNYRDILQKCVKTLDTGFTLLERHAVFKFLNVMQFALNRPNSKLKPQNVPMFKQQFQKYETLFLTD